MNSLLSNKKALAIVIGAITLTVFIGVSVYVGQSMSSVGASDKQEETVIDNQEESNQNNLSSVISNSDNGITITKTVDWAEVDGASTDLNGNLNINVNFKVDRKEKVQLIVLSGLMMVLIYKVVYMRHKIC